MMMMSHCLSVEVQYQHYHPQNLYLIVCIDKEYVHHPATKAAAAMTSNNQPGTGAGSKAKKKNNKNTVFSPTTKPPRAKDRVGAYHSSWPAADKTPRRGSARNLFFTDDLATTTSTNNNVVVDSTSSFISSSSSSSSVYARLYRNEKRTEKLWTKPPAFTPKLQNRKRTFDPTTPMLDTSLNTDAELLLPSSSIQPIDHHHHEQQQQTIEPPLDSSSPLIDTTIDEDLEAIKELGRQIGGFVDDCSPTGTPNSLSTYGEGIGIARHPIASTTTVDEDISLLDAVGQQLDEMEADQQHFLLTGNAPLLLRLLLLHFDTMINRNHLYVNLQII